MQSSTYLRPQGACFALAFFMAVSGFPRSAQTALSRHALRISCRVLINGVLQEKLEGLDTATVAALVRRRLTDESPEAGVQPLFDSVQVAIRFSTKAGAAVPSVMEAVQISAFEHSTRAVSGTSARTSPGIARGFMSITAALAAVNALAEAEASSLAQPQHRLMESKPRG
jgi:hypothetical protein